MKTITEFSGFTLKDAMAKKAALLTEGKSEEEAQAAINEQLKLADDTKIAFYKNAVDMTSSRIGMVKRVIVAVKATETESVPTAFAEREGHFYLVEFFPDPNARQAPVSYGRDDRGGRGGDRGRGGRGGGEGRGRGDSMGRGDGGGYRNTRPGDERPRNYDAPKPVARPEGAFAAARPYDPNAPKPEARKPRPPKAPRAPRDANAPRTPRPERTDRAPRGPKGAGELRLVFKGQSAATTLQGSGTGETAAPASTETPSS